MGYPVIYISARDFKERPEHHPPSFLIGEDLDRTFGPEPELKGDAGEIKGTPTRALD